MLSTYSNNSLGTYRDCPRQFKYRYIERIEVPRRLTADTYLGSAVHRVLADLYKTSANGVVLPLDEVLRSYDAEWEKPEKRQIEVPNERMTVDDYIENGRKMLELFYERCKPFSQGILLGVEMRLYFILPGSSYRMMGIVDKLWKRGDGVVEIVDYKTGSHLPQGGTDPKFSRQMGLYQLAVQEKYPQFGQIEQVQHFLKMDEIISYRMRPDELDELAERFRNDILDIHTATRLDDFPTIEGAQCRYCDFIERCPAKRHKLMVEAEEAAGEGEKATYRLAADKAEQFIELDEKLKRLKNEHEALKEDLRKLAEELGLDKFSAENGHVNVKITRAEKFVTKTLDADKHAELTHLAREWGLEDYFTLDTRALMREIYRKQRLEENRMTQLKEFVVEDTGCRVTVKRKLDEDAGDV